MKSNNTPPQSSKDISLVPMKSGSSTKGSGKNSGLMQEVTGSISSEVNDQLEQGKAMAKEQFDDIKEELKEQMNEVKEQVQEAVTDFFSELLNGLLDGVGLNIDKIETPFVDMYNLPGRWKVGTYAIYFIVFIIVACTMFTYNYTNAKNNTFLSEDQGAGVCKDEDGSDQCCEVPFDVSGNYLADTQGRWNTDGGFSYLDQIYGVVLSGYNAKTWQYQQLMTKIQSQVLYLGQTKGTQRDYSWNIITWASYTYIATGFQFFTSANVGKMFNKPLSAVGINGQAGACDISITQSYQLSSRTVSIDFNIESEKNCDYDNGCTNPCPNVLSPQGMGYDPLTASFFGYTSTIDMAAITTAIAVNQGIISINVLQNFSDDSDRINLLGQMQKKKYISKATNDATFSYYNLLSSPTSPIYCTSYNSQGQPDVNANASTPGSASCLVRIGKMMFYPVINSYGYAANNDSEEAFPNSCNNSTATMMQVLKGGTPANYYCNLFNFVVGLINYPTVDNPLPAQPTERSRKATEENTHGDAQPTKTMKLHDQMKSKYFNAQASNDATLQQTDDIFDDDIVNSLDDVIDNGYVFTFAQSVANILRADPNNGDLYMPRAAYKPMLNSILNEFPGGITTYDELYQNLCSVGEITNNCSVLSILFEGDTDRTISDYNYQPSTDGAYQNTLYNETSFHNIIINPPVTLVYDYYSCVLASTQAFVEATGLTFANTQLYMGTIMLVYMTAFVLIQYYQSEGKNLPRKLTKRLQEAKMKVMNDQMKELMALKNQIKESVQNAKAQVTDTIDDVRQQSKAVRDAVNNPMQQIRD